MHAPASGAWTTAIGEDGGVPNSAHRSGWEERALARVWVVDTTKSVGIAAVDLLDVLSVSCNFDRRDT